MSTSQATHSGEINAATSLTSKRNSRAMKNAKGLLYEKIMAEVRKSIRYGELNPGEKIKLREDLNREYGVSSVTMQRAFSKLAEDGFVNPRGRAGTFIADYPPNLYRIGILFDGSKAESFKNKYYLGLITAALEYSLCHQYTIVPYYGIGLDSKSSDRPKLEKDLYHERLGGLIWVFGNSLYCKQEDLPNTGDLPGMSLSDSEFNYLSQVKGRLIIQDFIPVAIKEIAEQGGRKIALLSISTSKGVRDSFIKSIDDAGLETRSYWHFPIGEKFNETEWMINHALQSLVELPEEMRPDSLIISDDNFDEFTSIALMRLKLADKLKLVFHANFPLLKSPLLPSVRVGYDANDILDVSIEIITEMQSYWQKGEDWSRIKKMIPAQIKK